MNGTTWQIGAITDRGLVRNDNQDDYYVSPDGCLLVVADGMGGAANGAMASKAAVQTLERCWSEDRPDTADDEAVARWLQIAVRQANLSIMKIRGSFEPTRRPGTTIVVTVRCDDGTLRVAHVGDSRAYVFRRNQALFVTIDHTVVMELVLANRITEQQARTNDFRNVLTRCLGHDASVEIDHSQVSMKDGDWIILCSDGLCGVMDGPEILDVLNRSDSVQGACESLVSCVMERNAPDNVTVIAARYHSTR
ncbi:MAG: protein phosphatase 2C domain-containing protein [Candidatus Obscuribacterales bacterium]|nr:protein phosphatase 2C domain-containing protein [Candidatus Obscuribacterales bacterium]